MSRPVINPGKLHWSGEQWINCVPEPGAETNSAMITFFQTRRSSAGQRTAALVDVLQDKFWRCEQEKCQVYV